ncbi:hypothetical protein [Gimesia panareensis]|uniref:hypothetical protein n=1 Tax=Gimesia panareensis TaxID=2527978 RepID=UPI00119CF00C|nr:hypothetical protein [Gimesia panareensis]
MKPPKSGQTDWSDSTRLKSPSRSSAKTENVSKASYYYWRRKVRGRRKIRGTTRRDHQRLRDSTSAPPRQTGRKPAGFLPVTLAASSPATVMAVDLPGGIRIRFEIPSCSQEARS